MEVPFRDAGTPIKTYRDPVRGVTTCQHVKHTHALVVEDDMVAPSRLYVYCPDSWATRNQVALDLMVAWGHWKVHNVPIL